MKLQSKSLIDDNLLGMGAVKMVNPKDVTKNIRYEALNYLTGFLLWRLYRRQFWGNFFLGGIFPSKMRRFAPFLATIQALSKTCVFLFNKRSEGCFVSDAPSLVIAPTIS
jgi:hypothetical protein